MSKQLTLKGVESFLRKHGKEMLQLGEAFATLATGVALPPSEKAKVDKAIEKISNIGHNIEAYLGAAPEEKGE